MQFPAEPLRKDTLSSILKCGDPFHACGEWHQQLQKYHAQGKDVHFLVIRLFLHLGHHTKRYINTCNLTHIDFYWKIEQVHLHIYILPVILTEYSVTMYITEQKSGVYHKQP